MDLDSLAGDVPLGDGPAPVPALPLPGAEAPSPPTPPVRRRAPRAAPSSPPQLEGVPVGYLLDDGHVRRGAGIALILSAAGMLAGGILGGPSGAFAGLSFVGATRNALRAQRDWKSSVEEERVQAGHSAVMSAIGFSIGGFLTYRAYQTHYGIKEIA